MFPADHAFQFQAITFNTVHFYLDLGWLNLQNTIISFRILTVYPYTCRPRPSPYNDILFSSLHHIYNVLLKTNRTGFSIGSELVWIRVSLSSVWIWVSLGLNWLRPRWFGPSWPVFFKFRTNKVIISYDLHYIFGWSAVHGKSTLTLLYIIQFRTPLKFEIIVHHWSLFNLPTGSKGLK